MSVTLGLDQMTVRLLCQEESWVGETDESTRLRLPGSFPAELDVGLAIQSGLLSVPSQWCRPRAGPFPLMTDSL